MHKVEAGGRYRKRMKRLWDSGLQGKPEIQEFGGKRLGAGNLWSLVGDALHRGIPLYPDVFSGMSRLSLITCPSNMKP